MRRAVWVAGLVVLLVSGAVAARVVSGVVMPDQITIEGQPLALNGTAVQKKWWFRIYAVGLYLEHPTSSAREAITSDQIKRVHLRMMRDLAAERVRDALLNGFRKVAPEELPELQGRIRTLLGAVGAVRDGDDIYFTYVPGQGTYIQGEHARHVRIPGKDFADALFAIWLGERTPSPNIREGLLGKD